MQILCRFDFFCDPEVKSKISHNLFDLELLGQYLYNFLFKIPQITRSRKFNEYFTWNYNFQNIGKYNFFYFFDLKILG